MNAALWEIVDVPATPDGSPGSDDDGLALADGRSEFWQAYTSPQFRNAPSISCEDFWDAWFAVVVKGTPGVSEPMFPVFPRNLQTAGNGSLAALLDGNLGQGGVNALGFTNALYADVDGGGFDAPGVSTLGACP